MRKRNGPCGGENDPLVILELRSHAHDAMHPHHDRDHRSLICFAPGVLSHINVCVIRVSPSCRFTTHVISALTKSDDWICLMAHHQHMRLAAPVGKTIIEDLVTSPQSVAQPVGWKSLLEMSPYETTIASKCLGKCPRCQKSGIRLPLGIEGTIVGRSALMNGRQLREFAIEKHWSESQANMTGAEDHRAWVDEQATPPLDTPPGLNNEQQNMMGAYIGRVPNEESKYDAGTWKSVASLGDLYILSIGCMYKAAHGYISAWRQDRPPPQLYCRPILTCLMAGRSPSSWSTCGALPLTGLNPSPSTHP